MTSRVDPTVVRRANLGVVLRHIATAGPISRARVAADTGLNKSTVSSLVAELDELGLVREGADAGPRPGRRPAGDADRHHRHDGRARPGDRRRRPDRRHRGPDRRGALRGARARACCGEDPPLKVLDDLAALAREAFARAQTDELRVVGVGVAVPGLVDVGLRHAAARAEPRLDADRDRRRDGGAAGPADRRRRRRQRGEPGGAGRALGRRGARPAVVHPRHRARSASAPASSSTASCTAARAASRASSGT